MNKATTMNLSYAEKKQLRTNQVRRQKNLLYISAIVVLSILIITIAVKIYTNPNKVEASNTGHYVYESILVEQGDSLWTIAKEHICTNDYSIDNYIREVKELNQLSEDDMNAGDYIVIPVYREL
ncbi:MAG: LysM peptidoglycan-binding domain-containing protein [Lachnospiraceae bacterium]|nr:LysM peptidoglycan-binding domain-containing protein [Lachnospiraceae bacterium]